MISQTVDKGRTNRVYGRLEVISIEMKHKVFSSEDSGGIVRFSDTLDLRGGMLPDESNLQSSPSWKFSLGRFWVEFDPHMKSRFNIIVVVS